MCRHSVSPCKVWSGLNYACCWGAEVWQFLCGCLCILSCMLLSCEVCAVCIAIRPSKFVKSFDGTGYEKVCSCACMFNFWSSLLGGDTTKCRIWNCSEIWGLFPKEWHDAPNKLKFGMEENMLSLACHILCLVKMCGYRAIGPLSNSKFGQIFSFSLHRRMMMLGITRLGQSISH